MSLESVREYLKQYGLDQRIQELNASSATAMQAAEVLGVHPAQIAKSLAFRADDGCVLLLASGDARVSNSRYKSVFGRRSSLLTHEDTLRFTGHAVGGVCPFAIENVGIRRRTNGKKG